MTGTLFSKPVWRSAAVPLAGVEGEVSPLPRLALGGWGRWFDLTFDQFSGAMTELGARADYFPVPHAGIGLGWKGSLPSGTGRCCASLTTGVFSTR